MGNNTMIISVDGHAAPPMEAYRPYLEKKFLPAFEEQLAAHARVSIDFFLFFDPVVVDPWKKKLYDTGIINGRWDADLRVKELAAEGIVAEVLFPDGAPFGAAGIGHERVYSPPDEQLAGGRAYNRWLADFISAHPQRFAAQGIVTLCDIDEAVKDVYWCAEHGFRGLVMPGVENDVPKFWDPVYVPFWKACEETGLVLNFHGGIGFSPGFGPQIEGVPMEVRIRVGTMEFPFMAHRPLWWLLWSGVLERHPGLTLVFTEQHSDWVPSVLAKMDHSYQFGKYRDDIKKVVPRLPSEYWKRQCYTGSSILSRHDLACRHEIGVNNMMFGADFPHPEGTFTNTTHYLQATVGVNDMPEDETRAFLGGTAARVFRFDVDALAPLVAKTGLDIDTIRTPLPAQFESEFTRTDVLRPA
ncbi:amidohydrolase family protein [Dactylosporangium sp. CA-092794]|uniref:amidohydrolase family protein n=1 Tax=Dactylosporangium sp. CA-092794 TaxID=3239929 RepID=UPI003D89D447